jgi:putative SOS response-associated peptidase YedK
MCGRYTLTVDNPEEIASTFHVTRMESFPWRPRFNIAPSQIVPVIVSDEGKTRLTTMRWGLVPSWAEDEKIGYKMINARSETVAEKPSFKRSFRSRRCLVPVDGFYEWKKSANGKIPMRIRLKTRELFGLAGLWDQWHSSEGKVLHTFTILTTQANQFMKSIHDRMPVILPKEAENDWFDQKTPVVELQELLKPYADREVTAYPVSTLVNSPQNDIPECIESENQTD